MTSWAPLERRPRPRPPPPSPPADGAGAGPPGRHPHPARTPPAPLKIRVIRVACGRHADDTRELVPDHADQGVGVAAWEMWAIAAGVGSGGRVSPLRRRRVTWASAASRGPITARYGTRRAARSRIRAPSEPRWRRPAPAGPPRRPTGRRPPPRGLGSADRQDGHLHRGVPGRERAAVLLDQVREQPLHAADDAAVHHHRPVLAAVRADVRQVELLRLVEVDLDGGQGRLPAGGVRRSARRSSGRRTRPPLAPRRSRPEASSTSRSILARPHIRGRRRTSRPGRAATAGTGRAGSRAPRAPRGSARAPPGPRPRPAPRCRRCARRSAGWHAPGSARRAPRTAPTGTSPPNSRDPQRQLAVDCAAGAGRSARGAGTGSAAARTRRRRRAASAGTCRRRSAECPEISYSSRLPSTGE